MPFNVIGIVNPDAKWVSRLDDEHKKIQAEVNANEPNCLTYMVYRQTNDKGQVTFVIHEKFMAKADFDHHFNQPYSVALSKLIMDNNMCSERGMEIKFVDVLAGFESRP